MSIDTLLFDTYIGIYENDTIFVVSKYTKLAFFRLTLTDTGMYSEFLNTYTLSGVTEADIFQGPNNTAIFIGQTTGEDELFCL